MSKTRFFFHHFPENHARKGLVVNFIFRLNGIVQPTILRAANPPKLGAKLF
jgi:hypothetical protein